MRAIAFLVSRRGMNSMSSNNELGRRAYLDAVFERLDGPGGKAIRAKAAAVVDKWEQQPGVHRSYVARWRDLLERSTDEMHELVIADTAEGEALRHCMPFAGVLSNRERADLRGRGNRKAEASEPGWDGSESG